LSWWWTPFWGGWCRLVVVGRVGLVSGRVFDALKVMSGLETMHLEPLSSSLGANMLVVVARRTVNTYIIVSIVKKRKKR
jgi:hypothetical protein